MWLEGGQKVGGQGVSQLRSSPGSGMALEAGGSVPDSVLALSLVSGTNHSGVPTNDKPGWSLLVKPLLCLFILSSLTKTVK